MFQGAGTGGCRGGVSEEGLELPHARHSSNGITAGHSSAQQSGQWCCRESVRKGKTLPSK